MYYLLTLVAVTSFSVSGDNTNTEVRNEPENFLWDWCSHSIYRTPLQLPWMAGTCIACPCDTTSACLFLINFIYIDNWDTLCLHKLPRHMISWSIWAWNGDSRMGAPWNYGGLKEMNWDHAFSHDHRVTLLGTQSPKDYFYIILYYYPEATGEGSLGIANKLFFPCTTGIWHCLFASILIIVTPLKCQILLPFDL